MEFYYMQESLNNDILDRKSFVKYLNKDFPCQIHRIEGIDLKTGKPPFVTVIIPTLEAYRNGYFPELLKQIQKQSFQEFELIIVQGDPRQGRAINTAATMAKGEILIIMDDDTRLGHNRVFENLVNTFRDNSNIGMAGVSNLIPSDASWLIRTTMKELPRRDSKLVKEIVDSDMAEHPCCAIPKKVFYEVGGEREDIRRGLDPYLRYRIRSFGYRIVVIPDTWIHHLPPGSVIKLIKQFFRNGMVVGLDRRTCREAPYELVDAHTSNFLAQRSHNYRMLRFLWRILKSVFTFRFVYLSSLLLYAVGLVYGRFFKKNE
jgi:glycosyltransferase involved in cell wall biosynthesis